MGRWLHDRRSDDAGSVGWRWTVGEKVIKPKMRTVSGRGLRAGFVGSGREGGEEATKESHEWFASLHVIMYVETCNTQTRILKPQSESQSPYSSASPLLSPRSPLLSTSPRSSTRTTNKYQPSTNHGRRSNPNRKWNTGAQQVGPHRHPYDLFCCLWCVALDHYQYQYSLSNSPSSGGYVYLTLA